LTEINDINDKILALLSQAPLGTKYIGISTYEICRRLNSVKQRGYCGKFRRSREKKGETSNPLFVSAEPIMWFRWDFIKKLTELKPWAVALGYDNYANNLREPSPELFWSLVGFLEEHTKLYLKTVPKKGLRIPQKYEKEGSA